MTIRRTVLKGMLGLALAASVSGAALAQDAVKIGLILPMTGPFASTGRQIAAVLGYSNGNEIIHRDDMVIVGEAQ